MCLVNDNEQFDAVKQFVFLEVVIIILMMTTMMMLQRGNVSSWIITVIPNDHHLENNDGYDDVDDKVKNQGTQVGVTADMGISIDGGEEYREGVLTITEVNAILIV